MATRLRAALPLTLSIGLLAFLASEVALNFTFHWVTVEDGGRGTVVGAYGVPQNVHLILPAGQVLNALVGGYERSGEHHESSGPPSACWPPTPAAGARATRCASTSSAAARS